MQKSVQFLFHLGAVANFGYGIYYDLFKLKLPEEFIKATSDYAGRWKYLTFWNMVLQMIYFSWSLLNDILGSSSLVTKERKGIQVIRDYLFGSLVFPLGMFVASIFWILWAIDRELVFPVALDAFFPFWLNHIMHTSIVPLDFMELIFVPKVFPGRAKAITGLSILMLSYLAWVFFIAYKTDFWVYPVLAVLNWNLRLVFIVALIVIACVLYFIGEKLHFTLWGQPVTPKAAKPVQKPAQKPVQKPVKEGKAPTKGAKVAKVAKDGKANKRKQN